MKEYKESDAIFGNMLFVEMVSSKLIIWYTFVKVAKVLQYNVFIFGNLSPKCDSYKSPMIWPLFILSLF
jgi:hypothetical protein